MSDLKIERCLTISICHISVETAQKIEERYDSMVYEGIHKLSIYNKEEYGWWIYVPWDLIETYNDGKDIPEDLWACMLLALENNCTWLCLDEDGQEVDELEMFDWWKGE